MPPPRLKSLPAANKIFVNREGPLRLFENAAFNIPANNAKLLTFYGIGGQGKTALCRQLMQITQADPSYGFLRRAELDLHGRPKTDPDLLLVWIRNGFADAGVALPCFDLALAIVWEATRGEQPFPKLSKAWLGKAKDFAGEGAAGASKSAQESLGEAVAGIPGVGFLVKKISSWVIDKTHKAYLHQTREALQELYRDGELKKPYELSVLLPWILAQDLNYHIARHPEERFVLLIDEYERVFDQGSAGSLLRENPFDRHLRTFVRETNGLLAVFFSRERLPWENDPEWVGALQGVQHLLGGLSEKDADAFLQATPIPDAAIRSAMIDGARETSASGASIYPLMLDLQVEHWRALVAQSKPVEPASFRVNARDFVGRRREIVERVLRDYGEQMQKTLMRLSCARRFDRAAFEHVVRTFHTGLPIDAFDSIDDLSFLTKGDNGFVSMHGIMSDAIREMLDSATQAATLEALFEHFVGRATVSSNLEVTNATVAALFEAADAKKQISPGSFARWLGSVAQPLYVAARYADLAALWQQALTVTEKHLGPNHPDTAASANSLGEWLCELGDFAEAQPYLERALAIREKALGPDHPNTANSLNSLGSLLHAKGDFAGAQSYYERALAIDEKAFGPRHRSIAANLNNLGVLLRAQGDSLGARLYYERALAIYEKTLGANDPAIANSLNNLGVLLLREADLAGARSCYERALAINLQALGPDHPDTAKTLRNLGGLLREQGDLAGARSYCERALAIREKALGPNHSGTATSLKDFGDLLREQGDLAGARLHLERALAIREEVLGPNHLDTADSLNNLGTLLQKQGNLAGARSYLARALAIREKALGSNHLDTADSLNNLGSLLEAQGELTDARRCYERALPIYEQMLGPNHSSIAKCLNNLGGLLHTQGDLAGARQYLERALAINEKSLGPKHPSTATNLNNLSGLLQRLGDSAGARRSCERALAIREEALGPNHPDTANSVHNLGILLHAQGDLIGARRCCERALTIRERALAPVHPDTAHSLNHLGGLLDAEGDLAGARGYYERALAIREKVLGSVHPDTANSLQNLGSLLHVQGDLAGARRCCEQALAINEKLLGPNHLFITYSLDSLGAVLREEGDLAGARRHYARALAINETLLGPNHRTTGIIRAKLASLDVS